MVMQLELISQSGPPFQNWQRRHLDMKLHQPVLQQKQQQKQQQKHNHTQQQMLLMPQSPHNAFLWHHCQQFLVQPQSITEEQF